MASLPRPLLALLIAAIAFFAAWMVVLKPHSSSGGAAQPAAGAYNSPVSGPKSQAAGKPTKKAASGTTTKAKPAHASAVSRAAAAREAKAQAARRHAVAAVKAKQAAAQRRAVAVDSALAHNKVLAVLFYNPAAADDLADRHTLAAIPGDHGRVFKLAVPIDEISRYDAITNQVPVTSSPTLVVIDRRHQAQTLTGFADQLEFDQLVAAALSVK